MPMNFDSIRSRYESRVTQLEQEVLDCIKGLNKMQKDRRAAEQNFINYVQTDTHILWKFDMHWFPARNIKLELVLEQRLVKLYSYHKYQDQLVEVIRMFQLPKRVDIDLRAKLSVDGVLTIQAPLRIAGDDGQDGHTL